MSNRILVLHFPFIVFVVRWCIITDLVFVLFCAYSRSFMLIFNTFSFCLPSPKAGDDNLMQEVNQNLAEEVRIVDFQKCILIFGWYIHLLSVTDSPCVLFAGWSEHHPYLPSCGERGRWGKTAGHVTLLCSSPSALVDLWASLAVGGTDQAFSQGWTFGEKNSLFPLV